MPSEAGVRPGVRVQEVDMTDETTTPEHWDKGQMETDDPGEDPAMTRTADAPGSSIWNKGEMAEESEDGSGGPGTEPVEPPGGLSGKGSNPGGGERWADRDREG
jgi:hypothetical protein